MDRTGNVDKAYRMLRRETRKQELRAASGGGEGLSGKFPLIYADPPWDYRNDGLNGAAANHYPTMTTDAICALEIATREGRMGVIDLTTADSVLFLWCPPPLLEDAMRVIKAWGFAYKTNLAWDKGCFGTGFYFRAQHEHLLLGVKGVAMCPDENTTLGKGFAGGQPNCAGALRQARKRLASLHTAATG
jgi:hypothetical protein